MPEPISVCTVQFECVNDSELLIQDINKVNFLYKIGDKINFQKLNLDSGKFEKLWELEVVDIKHDLYCSYFGVADPVVTVYVKKLGEGERVVH